MPELQLKRKVKISAELERILENENTVSLHIRLTDYLKTPSSICRQKYYDEAMEFIKKRVNNPWFVIFTDDLDAAKCKYKFNGNIIWMEKGKYKVIPFPHIILQQKISCPFPCIFSIQTAQRKYFICVRTFHRYIKMLKPNFSIYAIFLLKRQIAPVAMPYIQINRYPHSFLQGTRICILK